VNLALAPSQTGSSIKLFILAAALQAGATDADILDGRAPCELPNIGNTEEPTFRITNAASLPQGTLRQHTASSINCAFARLSQIVGLNRMVDTVYRMSASPYLYPGQPADQREPIQPYSAFATGANELSTLDMAAGIQTIANEGIHMEPYYVEYIEDAAGERIYAHSDPGTEVLDRQVALTAIDIMKDVLTRGTADDELADFASRRPAFGKTGTQQSNWTAFFVGATTELSTAVMVRDPDRYTEMRDIPEFSAAGVGRVQGGTFPARIWGAFMEDVGLEQFEFADWDPPGEPPRRAARLYLPGNECVFQVVGYQPAATVPAATAPPAEGSAPQGFRLPAATPTATPTTEPAPQPSPEATTPPGTTVPPETVPPTTQPPVPIYAPVETGTTIPPDVLDPNAPMPSVPLDQVVRPC
jgi:penicillin-binding protein 1A